MIRFIAAVDLDRGIANEHGIPWKLPHDQQYFKDKTIGQNVLMGSTTYQKDGHLAGRRNIVVSHSDVPGADEVVHDPAGFLRGFVQDMWVVGGAKIFEVCLPYADEIYITRVMGRYGSTKFFPRFEEDFELVDRSGKQTENGTDYYFEVYKRLPKQG